MRWAAAAQWVRLAASSASPTVVVVVVVVAAAVAVVEPVADRPSALAAAGVSSPAEGAAVGSAER